VHSYTTAKPCKAKPDPENDARRITLNLRLAGQYYDAETGLHDNWHRTYNPGTGRYLQPDPLGYRDSYQMIKDIPSVNSTTIMLKA
jgi:RHS repeat-associated protein